MKGLSTDQRRRFDERGLVRLEGLIAPAAAEAMADRLWQALADLHGLRRREPATWKAERPAKFGPLQKSGAFEAMATPGLLAVLDDLIGRDRWAPPPSWGLPLVCFPQDAGSWDIPNQVWHLDLTPDPKRLGMMVGRLFVLLAPLRPRGGGTLVATGSHKIVAALAEARGAHMSSQEMRKRLAQEHAWFADLMSPPKAGEDRIARYMGAPTVVNGVPLQVEEITGEPGDAFLMHPNALHGLSSCALATPRLALAQTVYPKAWF
jgi:hypothetical protein